QDDPHHRTQARGPTFAGCHSSTSFAGVLVAGVGMIGGIAGNAICDVTVSRRLIDSWTRLNRFSIALINPSSCKACSVAAGLVLAVACKLANNTLNGSTLTSEANSLIC